MTATFIKAKANIKLNFTSAWCISRLTLEGNVTCMHFVPHLLIISTEFI